MNKKLLLIWTFLLCFVMGMSADKVITFKENTADKDLSVKLTTMNDIVASGSEYLSGVSNCSNVYLGRAGRGIKLGASSKPGSMTLDFASEIKPTQIKFTARKYNDTEVALTVAGNDFTLEGNDVAEYSITLDGTAMSSVTISTPAKRAYITSITIVEGTAPTVATPTIEGTTPFFGSTTVTLGCTTEGAKIYYTLDGNDPTNANALYAEPFTLDKTTSVKAIAYNGETPSSVATKEFVAAPTVATVAELTALTQGTVFQFSGELTVIAAPSAKHLYVKDAAGNTTLLFDAAGGFAFEVGQHIAAGWQGKVDVYKSLFEAVPTTALTAVADVKDEITYDTKTAADVMVDNANTVAWLKGVTYTAPADGKKDFEIKEGETTVAGYNQFGIVIDTPAEGRTYDILGVISRFNDNAQFQPISIVNVPQVVAVNIAAETGADLAALVDAKVAEITAAGDKAGNIAITLAKDGAYTVSKTIETNGNISITGDADGIATIDASALTTPFTQIATDVAPSTGDFVSVGDISFKNIKVTGVAAQFFYANKQKVLIDNLVFNNSIVQVNGGNKTVFDTNGGGVIGKLDIQNSTIYANPQNTGALYSSQSGQKATDAGLEMQTISIQSSTLYNIAYNKNVNNHRQSNQKWLSYVVKNNLVLDCGKDGQFIKGLNGGQSGANPTWEIDNNSFLRTSAEGDIEDHGATEITGDENEPVMNTVFGITTFADIANGDFTVAASSMQAKYKVGDPRWLVEYVPEDITAEKALLQAEIQKAMDLITGLDPETDENVKALSEAIQQAKDVYNTAETKAEVNYAIKDLQAAEEAYQIAVAKKDLAALIETANALIEGKDATDANVVALKTVIDQVTEVAGKADVTLQELKDALVALQAAIDTYKTTTSISGVNATDADNGAWYTLQGVKVNKAQKGIFIHNGKKVVLK